jgi:molybdopterin-guanine dinucleotide biosynthesis protein A
MGRDKATTPVDGVPMATRTAIILRQAGCADVHLVGRAHDLQSLGFPVIQEPQGGHHPLFGVAAVLRQTAAVQVLFAPCDLINLSTGHVQALLAVKGPCVAICDGQVHPLLAVLPASLHLQAQRLAEAGAPARALVEGLPQVVLPPPRLIDANTPADLAR